MPTSFKPSYFIFILTLLGSHLHLSSDESAWTLNITEDGVEIYSKPAENGIIPFLAKAQLGISLESATAILMDLDNKNKWSPKLKSTKVHKKINEHKYIYSEYYATPWPAKDREFLMLGEVKGIGTTEVKFLAKSLDKTEQIDQWKEQSHIQAEVTKINVTLKAIDANTTSISFEFQGDLKGWMPKWLSNLIQKKWPKKFIHEMVNYAIVNY